MEISIFPWIKTREESRCLSTMSVAAFSSLCSSWCHCFSPSVLNCESCLGQSCCVHIYYISNEPKYWVLLIPVAFGSTHQINIQYFALIINLPKHTTYSPERVPRKQDPSVLLKVVPDAQVFEVSCKYSPTLICKNL